MEVKVFFPLSFLSSFHGLRSLVFFRSIHPSDHHSANFPPLLSSCNVTLAFLSYVIIIPRSQNLFSWWLPINFFLPLILIGGSKLLHRLSFINHLIIFLPHHVSLGFSLSNFFFPFCILLLSLQQLSYCPLCNVL